MGRQSKPYTRPAPRGNPDEQWTHNAYTDAPPTSSLSSRLASSSSSSSYSGARPYSKGKGNDLLLRLSGGVGKELIGNGNGNGAHATSQSRQQQARGNGKGPSKGQGMLGFQDQPPINPSLPNSGIELLPTGSQSALEGRIGRSQGQGPGQGIGPVRTGGKIVQLGNNLVGSAISSALNPQSQTRGGGSGHGRIWDSKSRPKELFPGRPGAKGGSASGSGSGMGSNSRSGMRSDAMQTATPVRAVDPSVYADEYEDRHGYGQGQRGDTFHVMGHSKNVWVRVDCLAMGTTAEDVVSAFEPAPITNARLAPSSNPDLVSIEIELDNRTAADEIVKKYHLAWADGNQLNVEIIRQGSGLSDRMGNANGSAVQRQQRSQQERQSRLAPGGRSGGREGYDYGDVEMGNETSNRKELLESRPSGRMYSDHILAADPHAQIIQVSSAQEQVRRADAWSAQTRGRPDRYV